MSLKDIKVPADNSDKQTTDAKSALPPLEFTVAADTNTGLNSFVIQDRQAVPDRSPTASYRVYFLPGEFAPSLMEILEQSAIMGPSLNAREGPRLLPGLLPCSSSNPFSGRTRRPLGEGRLHARSS